MIYRRMAINLVRVLLAMTILGMASAAQAAVGRTAGTFDVSPTGAATYQLPIWVPPGPKGVQPKLALRYNSQSGSGTMGPGWSLAGLSAITRCNATVAQDGVAEAVTLTANDKFCLNGNRLRLTGGAYGAAGSTYQTELADFSKITAVGAAGNGPASFTVQGKDGLIYEYGNTADSQVKATNTTTPYKWLLNKVMDRAGNNYSVVYDAGVSGSQGVGVPVNLSYARVSAGATTYTYKVVFGYGTDSSAGVDSGYVAGGAVVDSNLLTSISITRVDSGATIRKYVMGYEPQLSPSTRKFRLASVKECSDAALTDCLAPTTMTYQNGQSGMTGDWIFAGTVGYYPNVNTPAVKYDFNGDGRTDLGSYENGTWKVLFSTGTGFTAPYETGANTNGYWGITAMGDLLGNGKDGLLSNNNGTWCYHSWNGTSFSSVSTGAPVESGQTHLADVNGDGRPDLVRYDDNSHILSRRLNTSVGSVPSFASTSSEALWCLGFHCALNAVSSGNDLGSKRVGSKRKYDFNGDGREDFITQYWDSNWGNHRYGSFVSTPDTPFGFADAGMIAWGYPYVGDFNNDNCDDIGTTHPYKSVFQSGVCNGSFGVEVSWIPFYWGTVVGVLDWNGDGHQDILTNRYGYYDNGTFAVSLTPTSGGSDILIDFGDVSGGTASGVYFPLDVDGDGLDEMGYLYYSESSYNGDYGNIYFKFHNGSGIQPDLLTSITDGYGVNYSPSYVSIAQGNYTKGSGAIYPEKDIQTPMYVVSQVTASDGAGGTYARTYSYTGAREDVQGRGFLGFQSVAMTDSRADTPVVKTYYKTAFPYTGLVYQQDVFQHNGTTLISRTVNTLAVTTLDATANNQRHFPHVASTATDTYEVGGSKNGALITQSTASLTYDGYGNVISSTATVTDKDSASPQSPTYNQSWTTTVSNTFTPNTSHWCLNIPTQTTVTRSATGVAALTRTASLTPDYVNCRITRQVVEPSSPTYKVTTDYGYDSFGNVNSETVTGINLAARTTTVNWGATGQFPVSTTNALGHTILAGYDYGKGVQSSQTDPNGLITTWQYDSFGRKTVETRPDNTSTAYGYLDCAAVSGGCVNGDPASGVTGLNKLVMTATLRNTSGTALRDDWTYLDQFERPIVTKTRTLSGSDARIGTQYDALGRPYRQTAPCVAVGCSVYWTTHTYDALGRVTQLQRPISASNPALQTTTIAYRGLTTLTTDPQGKQTTRVIDPNGWLRRSQDHNGYHQNFTYDAFGSLKTVTDSQSNALFSAGYAYGIGAFQTQTVDMDLGTWNYVPNALGEVTGYTDAKGSAFTLTYDKLSRPLTRFVAGDGTTTWTWGNNAASFNIGQLQSMTATGSPTENYLYDNKGRLSQRQIISDATYNYDYTYSSTTGWLETLTYPTSTAGYRLKLQYLYQNGLLQQIKDFNASTIFWQANAMNPRGQITQETLGNGIVTHRSYDAVTGWLNSIQSGLGGGTGVQNESYLFDKVGNVTQRQHNTLGLTESFYYDNVYRLDYSQLNGVTNLDLSYDALGNITARSDVAGGGAWTYHTTKKHAVTQAGNSSYTYSYDANGNAITRNGYAMGWNQSNYPTSIAGGGETVSLYYDASLQRWKQVYVQGGTTETTIYVGTALEKVTTGGSTDWRHSIYAHGRPVAIMSRLSSGAHTTRYVLEDHQGSIAKLTSSAGTTDVSESFTAYGHRRNPSTWSGSPTAGDLSAINAVSRRGYTGHTALGSLGLNHMNGRVQDAVTGRFLSADPYLSEPANTQNYNRYSYAYNNPLSYTDPSGFDNVNGVTVTAYVSYISNITISGIYNFNSFNGWTGLVAMPPSNPSTNSSDASNQQGSVESSVILEEQEVRAHVFDMEVNWATPLAGNLRFSLFPMLGAAGVTVQKRTQTQKPGTCPAVPAAPPGVNVNNNIDIAKDYSWLNPGALAGLYVNVKNYGPWDYKRQGSQYEDFGNFNFGAVTAAMGMPYYVAQSGAGIYQQWKGTAAAGSGTPVITWPYGDANSDAKQIQRGMQYVQQGCNGGAK